MKHNSDTAKKVGAPDNARTQGEYSVIDPNNVDAERLARYSEAAEKSVLKKEYCPTCYAPLWPSEHGRVASLLAQRDELLEAANWMQINLHELSRTPDGQRITILVVTSDAKYCRATVNRGNGFVESFGGSIWPGELPEVFENRSKTGKDANLKEVHLAHFDGSVASLGFVRAIANAERGAK